MPGLCTIETLGANNHTLVQAFDGFMSKLFRDGGECATICRFIEGDNPRDHGER